MGGELAPRPLTVWRLGLVSAVCPQIGGPPARSPTPPAISPSRAPGGALYGLANGRRGAISIGGGRCRMRLRRFGKHCETKIADQSKAMGWQDLTHSDENAKYHCYRFARLISDDTGQELCVVMQFFEWGPAYALLDDCRLWPP